MTNDTTPHDPLEGYFQELRQQPPEVAPDVMQRVMAQALLERDARRGAGHASTQVAERPSRWRAVAAHIGGWAAIAALGTAALAGVWIGLSAPSLMYEASGGYVGSQDAQYIIDIDYDLAFGLDSGGETGQ